ncbi:MAG TPA: TetR/AcrR family transcriptional regulator [Solirubrobacteraceae bacterium]
MKVASHPQTTEGRILEVAAELFDERGYRGTTMRELASGVGVKAASLYNHFPSKQAILVRICLDGMREFYDGVLVRLQEIHDLRERMRQLIIWQVEAETRSPYATRISDEQLDALNPQSRRELIDLRDSFERILDNLLNEGKAQEIWHVPHVRVLCQGIIGICKVNPWYKTDGPLTPLQIGEMYAAFILKALAVGDPVLEQGSERA